jgi:hypothetical protein
MRGFSLLAIIISLAVVGLSLLFFSIGWGRRSDDSEPMVETTDKAALMHDPCIDEQEQYDVYKEKHERVLRALQVLREIPGVTGISGLGFDEQGYYIYVKPGYKNLPTHIDGFPVRTKAALRARTLSAHEADYE